MKITLRLSLAALAFALGMATTSAQTFNWGNTVNFDGDDGFQEMSFDSDGAAIDSIGSTFTFEIGTFESGFTPTAANVSVWHDNWNFMQATSYSPTLNWFTGAYSMTAGDVGREGLRAYIWVYDSEVADSDSDWFLVTGDTEGGGGAAGATDSNWRIPIFGGAGSTYDWRLSTANLAVWGSLNNDGDPFFDGPNEDFGEGIQRSDPGVYELQAHAVPEPSSMVLAFAGIMLGLRRRR